MKKLDALKEIIDKENIVGIDVFINQYKMLKGEK
jgi:hypothetical protein